MSIEYQLICDLCGAVGPSSLWRKRAREEAIATGWRRPWRRSMTVRGATRELIDICPGCVRGVGEEGQP